MRPVTPQKDGPPANEDITSADVQLIDAEGENRGVVNTREALAEAQDQGLDLVLISPNAVPPVAKMLDLGRFKYAAQKKADRKSTRLNSSHVRISYAVFCLKKKTKKKQKK